MPSARLEHLIVSSAAEFARHLVNALRDATVQDMAELQLEPAPPRPKRQRQPSRPPIRPAASAPTPKPRKKRTAYPKCAYPGCDKNRFPRGRGYCGDHWRKWKAGEIPGAEEYRGEERDDPPEPFTAE